eukprot:17863-Heterococcus_DN1.PRE.2
MQLMLRNRYYSHASRDTVCITPSAVLIGDHHQLPPVVKCQALQKHAHLDQSLFARFIRLGTPSVQLDAQGRARPALAALYSWRYKNLGNLPSVSTGAHSLANAGFARPFQLINVEDFQGHGETAPTAHFYQYMRLLGYPAEKIAILTTYNGQRALIGDVLQQSNGGEISSIAAQCCISALPVVATIERAAAVAEAEQQCRVHAHSFHIVVTRYNTDTCWIVTCSLCFGVTQRCANSPIFGMPGAVQTVDKYQGQQSDYVLLSLVRTKRYLHLYTLLRTA